MPPKKPLYESPLLAILRGGKQALLPTKQPPQVQWGVPQANPTVNPIDIVANGKQAITANSTLQQTDRLVGGQLLVPAIAKEIVQGTARGAAATGTYVGARALGATPEQAGQLEFEPDNLAKRLIFGDKPFSVKTEAIDPLISMGASEKAANKYGAPLLILMTAADTLTGGGKKQLLQKAIVGANDIGTARTVLRNAGMTDEVIDTFAFDKYAVGIKTEKEAGEFVKRIIESGNKAKQVEKPSKIIQPTGTELRRDALNSAEIKTLEDFIDFQRGTNLTKDFNFTVLREQAQDVADKFGFTEIGPRLADRFDEVLSEGVPSKPGAMDIKRVEPLTKEVDGMKVPKEEVPKTVAEAKASGQSFDEWVKGQGLFHGTEANIKSGKLQIGAGDGAKKGGQSGGLFLSDNPNVSSVFGRNVYQASSDIKKQVIDLTDASGVSKFRDQIGKTYKTWDGDTATFTKQDFDAMFPGGKTDFASVSQYPELVEKVVKENKLRGIAFNEYAGGQVGKTYQILDGEIPVKTRAQLKAEWDSVQPTPPKKSLLQTAKDNLRNPAMRQGGYAGNVPEGIKKTTAQDPLKTIAKSQVDSQDVSLTKTVAQKSPTRIKIDAEIKDIRKALQNKELTAEKIGELEIKISILEDLAPDVQLIRQIGGKQLSNGDTLSQVQASAQKLRNESDYIKSITRTEAEEILKNQKEYTARQVEAARVTRRAGLDDIITEYGYNSLDEADDAINQFNRIRTDIAEAKTQMREAKGERALSNKVAKVVSASTTERRSYVNFLRDNFNLVDSDVRKAARGRDFRMMGERDFDGFIRNLEQIAVERADTTQAKIELMDLIERRNFQREQAYRKVAGYPTISEMNAKQMREYASSLEKYQEGDVFLTERQLEVVDRSDLAGIKTMREAKEKLLEKIRQKPGFENTTLADLQVTPSFIDNMTYDTALAEKNPFYNHLVSRTQEHMIAGEVHFLEVQSKVLDLAKKAKASRERGVLGGARQMFVPKHDEIIRYLEAPMEQKSTFAKALTKEELDYANFVQQYYSDAYDHLVKIKELYGSRYVDQYFTHVRRDFLEAWTDDGFVKAVKEWWQSQKESQIIANIIDQDTGQILPKSKFFQYTLQRTGEITPSKNLTKVFLQYTKTFERKKMFDSMIPELDIYTQSLTPTKLTPQGLEMDRRLKTFVNTYLNNKKGRRVNFSGLVPQNGVADMSLRMGNTLVSMLDLGLSFIAQSAATVGETVATYQALGKIGFAKGIKRRVWDTGLKRVADPNANKILKEAEPFIGRNIWTELAEVDTPLMDRGMKIVFGGFSQATVEANKLYLLGSLSKAELASGVISPARMAELRLSAGRWRDMGKDVKSIVGSTSFGGMVTKYKGWAIPIARTNIKNIETLTKKIASGKYKEAVTSRELMETYRMVELVTAVTLIGSYVLSQKEDETFVGKLKARVYQEANTLLAGVDPTTFLSTPRLVSFLQKLGENMKSLVLLETYETDSQWGKAGDLKGAKGLQRQFTPATVRQFQDPKANLKTGNKELDTFIKEEKKVKAETTEMVSQEAKRLSKLDMDSMISEIEKIATTDEVLAEKILDKILSDEIRATWSKEEEALSKLTNDAKSRYLIKKIDSMTTEEAVVYLEDLQEREIISEKVLDTIFAE